MLERCKARFRPSQRSSQRDPSCMRTSLPTQIACEPHPTCPLTGKHHRYLAHAITPSSCLLPERKLLSRRAVLTAAHCNCTRACAHCNALS